MVGVFENIRRRLIDRRVARTRDRFGPRAYYRAVAYCDFTDGVLTAVRFRPLVLSLDTTPEVPRGIPYLAQGGEADAVLERLVHISGKHGTTMTIDGGAASVVLR